MRLVDGATNPTYWLLNDHLGSTAITACPPRNHPLALLPFPPIRWIIRTNVLKRGYRLTNKDIAQDRPLPAANAIRAFVSCS